MAATVVNESGNESLRETGGSDGNRQKGRRRQSSAEFGKPQGRQNKSDGDTADVRLGGAVRV
jgi:hypothetical protein